MEKSKLKENISKIAFSLNLSGLALLLVFIIFSNKISGLIDYIVFDIICCIIFIIGLFIAPIILGISYIKNCKDASDYIIISFIILFIENLLAGFAFDLNYRAFTGALLYFIIYGICFLIKKNLLLKRKTIICGLSLIFAILLYIGGKKAKEVISGAKVYKYDEQGNLIYEKDPSLYSPYKTWYEYKNNKLVLEKSVSKNKEKTETFTYKYDENGNQIAIFNKFGEIVLEHIYDSQNRLVEVKSLEGISEKHFYNQAGQKTRTEKSDETEVLYTYDERGNLIYEVSPDNYTIEYQYNDENVLTFKHKEDSVYIYNWVYFGDGSVQFTMESKGHGYRDTIFHDKDGNTILYETDFDVTKKKYFTKYSYWPDGRVKSKRIYTLYSHTVRKDKK